MIQEIITYIIISLASVYTLYNFYRFVVPNKNKAQGHSCSGGCTGCALSKNYNPKIKTIKLS